MNEYYSIKQVIEITGFSRSKIMKLIKDGKLQTYRVGTGRGTHKITQEQIDNCIRGKSFEITTDPNDENIV